MHAASFHPRAVVFAGGGNRCLWQAGFWSEAAGPLGYRPVAAGGVSAGATMACLTLAGRLGEALAHFKQATARNPRNLYPLAPLRGLPAFPHVAMYRETVLHAIDAPALARLHSGPDVRVLLARPPAWATPSLATAVGFAGYEAEKRLRNPVHPQIGRRLGFRPEVVSVRDCATPEALVDLLLATSCTPPITPILSVGGRPVLDGGIVDPVPVEIVADCWPILVLLTRSYPASELPQRPDRLYIQPSAPIPVHKWDYTNPTGLQAAFDLGRRDGESFAQRALQELTEPLARRA